MICNTTQSDYHATVLDSTARIIEHRTHDPDIFALCEHQHLLNPVQRNDHRVVVQQNDTPSPSVFEIKVVYCRVVEFPFPSDDLDFVATF